VTQRSREAALLRAVLGATRRQIITTSAVETLTTGLIGRRRRVAGVGLAGFSRPSSTRSASRYRRAAWCSSPRAPLAPVAGVVATVVAGVVPSAGSRIPPVAAPTSKSNRRSSPAGAHRSASPSWDSAQQQSSAPSPVQAVDPVALGAVACLIGAVVLGLVAARLGHRRARSAHRPGARLTGDLARQNAYIRAARLQLRPPSWWA
jgi:hypothetical protein